MEIPEQVKKQIETLLHEQSLMVADVVKILKKEGKANASVEEKYSIIASAIIKAVAVTPRMDKVRLILELSAAIYYRVEQELQVGNQTDVRVE